MDLPLGEAPTIGLLGEKTLHAAIKRRLSPDPATHEVRLGPYVADIYTGGEIFEVQTKQFGRLLKKLPGFLAGCPVTVVFPVAASKRLYWIDMQTGEISGGRLSPKRESPVSILPELYQLGELAFAPGLSFLILPAQVEEYRYQNGWSKDGKKGSTRCDRIPLSFGEPTRLATPADCLSLLPALPCPFTQKEFAKAARFSPRAAWCALRFLQSHSLVFPAGKNGNAFLFSLSPQGSSPQGK